MTDAKKKVLWKIVQTRFTFEGTSSPKDWIIVKLNHCMRSWRRKLKKRYYDNVDKPLEVLLKPPNSRVDPEQWENMVRKWESKNGKDCSERNLKNRLNSSLAHHMGTKTFARLRNELTKDGKEPDRITLFETAYGTTKGKPVDPESAKKISEINDELGKLPQECDINEEREKLFERIIGGDKAWI